MALTDSLISYWKLDEASGDAVDAHGSNTLTDNNTVGSATGKINNGRQFDKASSRYFSKADNTDLSTGDIDFTISAWVKPASIPTVGNYLCIVGKDKASNREFNLELNGDSSGKFNFFGGNLNQATWGTAPSTGTWYHVIVWHSMTDNQVGIVVNDGTPVTTATTGAGTDGTAFFGIGGREYSGFLSPFDGIIDEVGFWKRLLTSGERTQLYNSGAGLSYDSFGAAGQPTIRRYSAMTLKQYEIGRESALIY